MRLLPLLLLCLFAACQTPTKGSRSRITPPAEIYVYDARGSSGGSFSDLRFNGQNPADFRLFDKNGHIAITIRPDGQVEFGKGFTPTEATKQFAEEMRKISELQRTTSALSYNSGTCDPFCCLRF